MNRHPIGTADVIDKTQHAGKNLPALLAETPDNPNEGFGINTGEFYFSLPINEHADVSEVQPSYSIRVVDAYTIASGTNANDQHIKVVKITPAGVVTVIFDMLFTTTAKEIVRATKIDGATTYADMTLALGERLAVITTATGLDSITYTHVKFQNV